MKTFMQNAETKSNKWYIVDATNMPLGRLASQVAAVLRGKNKPTFTPNVDTGDFVIIVNCDKVLLTGKKLENKMYRYHTGHVGGLKEITYKKLMENKADVAVYEIGAGVGVTRDTADHSKACVVGRDVTGVNAILEEVARDVGVCYDTARPLRAARNDGSVGAEVGVFAGSTGLLRS